MRRCEKCKRPHPREWAVPFSVSMSFPGLSDAFKQGFICSWCHRDYKGRRRPMADEWAVRRFLHSLALIRSLVSH